MSHAILAGRGRGSLHHADRRGRLRSARRNRVQQQSVCFGHCRATGGARRRPRLQLCPFRDHSALSQRTFHGATAEYASLEALRDSLLTFISKLAAPGDTAIHVSSGPTRFKYWYTQDSASGYEVRVVVTDTSSCLSAEVERLLTTRGWVASNGYSADGPDGTVIGFVTRKYLCVLEGRWDGGDASDSTYVPDPGCELAVTCVPRREEDVPKY